MMGGFRKTASVHPGGLILMIKLLWLTPPGHTWRGLMKTFHWPQRSCGQGNIFTPVCHSVHGGVVSHKALRQTPPGPGTPPPPRTRHTTPPLDQTPPRPGTPPPQTRHTTTPPGPDTPPRSRLRHMVYERPVRILLECILVKICICRFQGCKLISPWVDVSQICQKILSILMVLLPINSTRKISNSSLSRANSLDCGPC